MEQKRGGGIKSSYLKNIASEGIHIWQFRYCSHKGCRYAAIGVWKTTANDQNVNCFVDNTDIDWKCTGYLITTEGKISNPDDPSDWDYEKMQRYPSMLEQKTDALQGNIIEMVLDLSQYKLKFKMNDLILATFDNIDRTSYKAVISLPGIEKLTLISYQDIYSNN